MKIQEVEQALDTSSTGGNDLNEDHCIICFQTVIDKTILLCSHDAFCFECMVIWTSEFQFMLCGSRLVVMRICLHFYFESNQDDAHFVLPTLDNISSIASARNLTIRNIISHRCAHLRPPVRFGRHEALIQYKPVDVVEPRYSGEGRRLHVGSWTPHEMSWNVPSREEGIYITTDCLPRWAPSFDAVRKFLLCVLAYCGKRVHQIQAVSYTFPNSIVR